MHDLPDVTFHIMGKEFTMTRHDYVTKGMAYGEEEFMTAFRPEAQLIPGFDFYVFGDAFIRKFYAVFEVLPLKRIGLAATSAKYYEANGCKCGRGQGPLGSDSDLMETETDDAIKIEQKLIYDKNLVRAIDDVNYKRTHNMQEDMKGMLRQELENNIEYQQNGAGFRFKGRGDHARARTKATTTTASYVEGKSDDNTAGGNDPVWPIRTENHRHVRRSDANADKNKNNNIDDTMMVNINQMDRYLAQSEKNAAAAADKINTATRIAHISNRPLLSPSSSSAPLSYTSSNTVTNKKDDELHKSLNTFNNAFNSAMMNGGGLLMDDTVALQGARRGREIAQEFFGTDDAASAYEYGDNDNDNDGVALLEVGEISNTRIDDHSSKPSFEDYMLERRALTTDVRGEIRADAKSTYKERQSEWAEEDGDGSVCTLHDALYMNKNYDTDNAKQQMRLLPRRSIIHTTNNEESWVSPGDFVGDNRVRRARHARDDDSARIVHAIPLNELRAPLTRHDLDKISSQHNGTRAHSTSPPTRQPQPVLYHSGWNRDGRDYDVEAAATWSWPESFLQNKEKEKKEKARAKTHVHDFKQRAKERINKSKNHNSPSMRRRRMSRGEHPNGEPLPNDPSVLGLIEISARVDHTDDEQRQTLYRNISALFHSWAPSLNVTHDMLAGYWRGEDEDWIIDERDKNVKEWDNNFAFTRTIIRIALVIRYRCESILLLLIIIIILIKMIIVIKIIYIIRNNLLNPYSIITAYKLGFRVMRQRMMTIMMTINTIIILERPYFFLRQPRVSNFESLFPLILSKALLLLKIFLGPIGC